jgi:sugar phosphate isomerase/epimerase
VAFDQPFRALAQVGYAGPATVEAFSPNLLTPEFPAYAEVLPVAA